MSDTPFQKKVFYVCGYPPGLVPSALNEFMADLPVNKPWASFWQSIVSRNVHIAEDFKITAAKNSKSEEYSSNDWIEIADCQPSLVVTYSKIDRYWFLSPSIPFLAATLQEYPDPFEFGGAAALSPVSQMRRFYVEPAHGTIGKIEGDEAYGGPKDHEDALASFKGSAILVPVMRFHEGSALPKRLVYQANYRKGGDHIWITERQALVFQPG